MEVLISNLVELQAMALLTDWSTNTYVQTADIDASPTQVSTYGTASDTSGVGNIGNSADEGFLPIGNVVNQFNTSYAGQGFSITGLYINRPTDDYIALFGRTNTTANLSNINLADVDITGRIRVGGLVGLIVQTTITKCKASGTLVGMVEEIGGLIGVLTTTTMSNSYSTVSVSGGNVTGGLCGNNSPSGIITNCYSTGAVTGTTNTGGFCGVNQGAINDCFYDSETSGQSDNDGRGVPKTTAEMMDQDTFDPPWDFDDIWYMDGYPKLVVFKDGGGGRYGAGGYRTYRDRYSGLGRY